MNKKILILLFSFLISTSSFGNENFPFYGSKDVEAPIKIKVFSSLTCPHCAEFHNAVMPKLIKDFVAPGKISITLMDYPLDLPSLKAAQLTKCLTKDNQKLYLDEVYKTQSQWLAAKTLEDVYLNLEKITKKFGLEKEEFRACLMNKKFEDTVLKSRIDAQSKYEINATPTVVINEKKFEGSFEELIKHIEKLL